MRLFEIRTGYMGESYVRAYAWAKDKDEALRLYAERNPERPAREAVELFDATSGPFCTPASDCGWEVP